MHQFVQKLSISELKLIHRYYIIQVRIIVFVYYFYIVGLFEYHFCILDFQINGTLGQTWLSESSHLSFFFF